MTRRMSLESKRDSLDDIINDAGMSIILADELYNKIVLWLLWGGGAINSFQMYLNLICGK